MRKELYVRVRTDGDKESGEREGRKERGLESPGDGIELATHPAPRTLCSNTGPRYTPSDPNIPLTNACQSLRSDSEGAFHGTPAPVIISHHVKVPLTGLHLKYCLA